jgi:uncharacterized damage-inducible protein DinB
MSIACSPGLLNIGRRRDWLVGWTVRRTADERSTIFRSLEQGWIHFVIRRSLPEWPPEDKNLNTVDAVRAEMKRVHTETMDYLAEVNVEDFNRIVQVPDDGAPKLGWILWHVFEQEIHHRGELFLCLSLLGMKRPKTNRPG